MSLASFNKQCSRIVILSLIYLCFTTAQSLNSATTNITVVDTISWVDTETALVLARPTGSSYYHLHRTVDGGLTWTDITSHISEIENSPFLAPIYVNEKFPSRVFIVGRGEYNYVSHDNGNTWNPVFFSGTIFVYIEWHPTEADFVLAQGADYNLYISKDGGKNWSFMKYGVTYFGWGDAGIGDVPATRVYYILYVESQTVPYNFIASDDWGFTELVLQTHAYQFVFFKHHIVTAIYLPTENEVALTASPDVGKAYKEFHDIEFSFGETLETNSFVFLDDSTGALYLGINHEDPYNSAWGNVYVSDSTGTRYVLSLEHVYQISISSHLVLFDFDSIKGVEGVFIANTVSNWEDKSGTPLLTSLYSVDNGNSWQPIPAPHFDSQGQPIICTGNCHLHLNGLGEIFNYFGPFYSSPTAIGLIVATGNVGDYLSDDENEVNTYLTRDGGISWIEVAKGSSIYEYGDHGGIIVFAPFGRETNTIYYTLDYGTTPLVPWRFTDIPVEIINVETEPSTNSEKFVIYSQHQIFALDFSKVFTRICNSSDYERWSPSNGRTAANKPECLMGHKLTYLRRNASRECFNDEDEDYLISTVNCECNEDDWECDFDFERNAEGKCVLIVGKSEPSYPPTYCPEGSTYFKTVGYRREAGNTCAGGVDHTGDGPYDCPSGVVSKSKGWIAAAVLVPLVVILIVVGCFAIRSEKVRDKLPFLKSLSTWKVGYFAHQDTALDIEEDDQYRIQRELEEQDDDDSHKFTVDVDDDEKKPQQQQQQQPFFDDE